MNKLHFLDYVARAESRIDPAKKFRPTDLLHEDYVDSADEVGDNPRFRKKYDSPLFSRHQRYEVYDLVIGFMRDRHLKDLDFFYLEFLIKEKLPSKIRGRNRVTDWISDRINSRPYKKPFGKWLLRLTRKRGDALRPVILKFLLSQIGEIPFASNPYNP